MSFTTILTGAGLVGGAVLQAQPLLIGACACGVFTLFRSLYLHGQSASIQRSIENKLLSIRSSLNQNLASVNREIERYNRQIEYFSKK